MAETPEKIHIFDVDTTWRKLSSGYADYVNNGNIDIFLCARPIAGSSNVDIEGMPTWRELL